MIVINLVIYCPLVATARLLNSHCMYHLFNFHGHDHVLLTKAEACQAEGGATFFGHLHRQV